MLGVLSLRDTSQGNVPHHVEEGVQQVSPSAGRRALHTNGAYEVRPSPFKDAATECVPQGTQDQRIPIGHAIGEAVKLMLPPSQALLHLHVERPSRIVEYTNERCPKTFEIANQRSTKSAKLDPKFTHMSEKYFSKLETNQSR